MSISNNKNIDTNKYITVKTKKPEFSEQHYPLGIDNYDPLYMRITKVQDKEKEFTKVNNFIKFLYK